MSRPGRNCKCGKSLEGLPSYFQLCRACFKVEKAAERDECDRERDELVGALTGKVAAAERANRALLSRVAELEALVLSGDFVRDLLMLCHPDLHDGSHRSNEVTRRLLDLRRALQ